MGKESFATQMENSMKVPGKRAKRMEMESSTIVTKVRVMMVFGWME